MTAPNRAEQAKLVAFLEVVAAEAKARAASVREDLDRQATAELDRDGVRPTWGIPGLGSVVLSLTRDSVIVTDEAAYTRWMAAAHPSEVEYTPRVRPAYDEHLRKYLAMRGECVDDEGTVIPGLRFVAGGQPRGVSVRPERVAKEQLTEAAHGFLDTIAAQAYGAAR